jgi:hypothetical protein
MASLAQIRFMVLVTSLDSYGLILGLGVMRGGQPLARHQHLAHSRRKQRLVDLICLNRLLVDLFDMLSLVSHHLQTEYR